MIKYMNELDNIRLLLNKKGKNISEEDKTIFDRISFILSDDAAFFNMDMETAIYILAYLGIPEEEIKDTYFRLISPDNFMKTEKPYVSISPRQ